MSTLAALALLPLLLIEALWVRWRTPRLPGATGPDTGGIAGPGEPFRLLVLGESTAAGVGATTHERALAGQVAVALARAVTWRVVGRNGVDALATEHELLPHVPPEPFDAVVIALGVNDVLHFHSPRRWSRDLTSLIDALRRRVGECPVYLSAVPPMDRFPALPQPLRFVLGLRARELDAAAARLAPTLPVVIHVSSEFLGGSEMFCSDRFHPSELGYSVWGRELAKAIAQPATALVDLPKP